MEILHQRLNIFMHYLHNIYEVNTQLSISYGLLGCNDMFSCVINISEEQMEVICSCKTW
jgi:hypothetical protein